ncbi:hypothetical protein CLOSTASPAR_00534 [[Clostridium] asparagiforme DSM 15981]|uniref:Uncharacterized protein n=1 Tax=[Clostridium] asparagiforme DSM 15981 TaxID=518636 RepID=C0CU85_9FIRM|nr:hypothetical protein CLOSTASPAR_00534 [[Clostridium] asparagiforme DSM 15981]
MKTCDIYLSETAPEAAVVPRGKIPGKRSIRRCLPSGRAQMGSVAFATISAKMTRYKRFNDTY